MMHNDLRTLTREAPTAVGGYLACISFFRVRVAAASLLDNQRAYELLEFLVLGTSGRLSGRHRPAKVCTAGSAEDTSVLR